MAYPLSDSMISPAIITLNAGEDSISNVNDHQMDQCDIFFT